MPRRTAAKCRLACDTGSRLDAADVFSVLTWAGRGLGDTPPFAARLREVWRRHGDRILALWAERMPGTRPWLLYGLGSLPLPEALAMQPYPNDTGTSIAEGVVLHDRRCHFGELVDGYWLDCDRGEHEWLRSQGALFPGESSRALARLQLEPGARPKLCPADLL